nr:putative zinc finger, CCHC-type [Tanacetum cinerariifolium]
MQHCSPTVAPVIKGDVFVSHQCPKTEVEYEEMKRIPYASVVGSLTYAQVCTRLNIAYICGMLGRFQSNANLLHWKAAKKVLRYLQGTKEYKLNYTRSTNLEVIGYSDLDFAKCKDTSRSTLGYIFMLSDDNILELRFEECSKDIKYSWNVLTSILKLIHSLIVVWNHGFLGGEELYAHACSLNDSENYLHLCHAYIFTRLRKKEAAKKDKKHTELPSTHEMETAPDYKGTAITPGNKPEKLQV